MAVVIALLILKADSISITLVFIITVNLSYSVILLTFTFLTAVICVPLFIELKRHRESAYFDHVLIFQIVQIVTLSYLVFGAILVHTATSFQRHTNLHFHDKAIIAHTPRNTNPIVTTMWWAIQEYTGWTTCRDTSGIVTIPWARGCWGRKMYTVKG